MARSPARRTMLAPAIAAAALGTTPAEAGDPATSA